MKHKLLLLLATPVLLAVAALYASAQQPGANDNVVYIVKQYTGSPMPGVYNYNLVLTYNQKQCVVAQGDSKNGIATPAAGQAPPAVVIPPQTLQNMWLLTDPQWLPWISPPPAVMQQIQAL